MVRSRYRRLTRQFIVNNDPAGLDEKPGNFGQAALMFEGFERSTGNYWEVVIVSNLQIFHPRLLQRSESCS
jgi:hypothetical protein